MRCMATAIFCALLLLAGCEKFSESEPGRHVDLNPGDRIQAGGLEISIDKIEMRSEVGDSFLNSTAAEGGVYLAVTWGYKNISNKPVDAGATPEIHLVAPDGAEYDPDFGASATYATQAGDTAKVLSDLNPGIRVREATVFEVSKQLFDPATWKLRVDANGAESFVSLASSSSNPEDSAPGEGSGAVPAISDARLAEANDVAPEEAATSSEHATTLTTDHFAVTISQHCEEGVVTCDDVSYSGVNRKTGKEIHLTGSTWHTTCADGVTPCRFLGYRFTNGNVTYLVHEDGTLEVTQTVNGDVERLVHERGVWAE